jgi:hypothetical protein
MTRARLAAMRASARRTDFGSRVWTFLRSYFDGKTLKLEPEQVAPLCLPAGAPGDLKPTGGDSTAMFHWNFTTPSPQPAQATRVGVRSSPSPNGRRLSEEQPRRRLINGGLQSGSGSALQSAAPSAPPGAGFTRSEITLNVDMATLGPPARAGFERNFIRDVANRLGISGSRIVINGTTPVVLGAGSILGPDATTVDFKILPDPSGAVYVMPLNLSLCWSVSTMIISAAK